MISLQVGFFAQLKGKLTKRRNRAATIFVDHFSRLWYVHLMTGITSEETVMVKKTLEHFAESHGVHIQHCHGDNGCFVDNAFKNDCKQNKWQITYCGVNSHFQNGISERAIRDIQEQAQKQLLHVRASWPEVMHLSLWPYAVRYAIHIHNTVPSQDDGCSRLPELFAEIRCGTRMNENHVFGCPFLPSKMISGEATQFQNGLLDLDCVSTLVLPHCILAISALCSSYPQT